MNDSQCDDDDDDSAGVDAGLTSTDAVSNGLVQNVEALTASVDVSSSSTGIDAVDNVSVQNVEALAGCELV